MEIVNAVGAWVFIFLLVIGAFGLLLKASGDSDGNRGSCIAFAGVIMLAAALATAALLLKPEILGKLLN